MDGKCPGWRVPFELARVLRRFPADNPVQFEPLVTAFFRSLGTDEFGGWVSFVNCWDIVRSPAGQDAWDQAVEAALARPFTMHPDPGASLTILASVAAYLAEASSGEPFVFSVPRVAKSFGWKKGKASYAIKALVKLGVIVWAEDTWSFTEGRAREALFVATLRDPQEGDGFHHD
jgi:hypothetical protein